MMATQSLKMVAVEYTVKIEMPVSKVTFDMEIKQEIKLEVTLDENGELKESSLEKYTSPVAKYEGMYSLIVSFSGLEAASSFAEVKSNSDGSFSLKLNRL